MVPIEIIRAQVSRKDLEKHLLNDELVKAVVDCKNAVIAVGGEMHADEEQVLLEQGSLQEDLWGINLYLSDASDGWIEFDSMINLRPRQGNRSRGVEDPALQKAIRTIVTQLVQ